MAIYVAFSRVSRKDRQRVIVNDEDSKDEDAVKNIVYKKFSEGTEN
jgi:hypothetical protein